MQHIFFLRKQPLHSDNSVTIKIITVNKNKVEGNWHEQKGKLIQKFASLTENDMMFAEGKKEEMFGKLQLKLGKTKEELIRIITNI